MLANVCPGEDGEKQVHIIWICTTTRNCTKQTHDETTSKHSEAQVEMLGPNFGGSVTFSHGWQKLKEAFEIPPAGDSTKTKKESMSEMKCNTEDEV